MSASTLTRSAVLPVDEPFTRAEANAHGVRDYELSRWVARGELRRLLRNVYVDARIGDSLQLRCAALRLVLPTDAFVCDLTAAWLYAGPDVLAPGAHLSVPPVSCFRPSDGGRLRNGIADSGERAILARDLTEVHGLVVTTPLRTALDLGRLQRTPDMRLWGMSAMLALGSFAHDELLAEIPRFRRQRGVVLLRSLAPRADPGFQSFGEAALGNRWWDAGLPRPTCQAPVDRGDGTSYWIDLALPEDRFGAEYDGRAYHSTQTQTAHDRHRRLWLAEARDWHLEVFGQVNVFGLAQDAEQRLRVAWDGRRR